MADLDFVTDLQDFDLRDTDYFSGVLPFWKLKKHDLPQSAGAYILLARGTRFLYPSGTSPVYYIGQSRNLRHRLHTHIKYASEAQDNRQLPLYWPRYEYAAKYGMGYCYVQTWKGLTPRALEENLLAKFARKHRAFPVANGAGSWNRINSSYS